MTQKQAREYINGLLPSELQPARKEKTYICPFCGNGSGKDGDGITSKDSGRHWKCFKCGFSGDYLDILKKQYGAENEREIFSRYNLTITIGGIEDKTQDHPLTSLTAVTEFIKEAHNILRETPEAVSYLKGRGISLETADRFMLGYCPEWKSPAALRRGKDPPPSRRLIFPTGKAAYTARAIDPNTPERYRFMKEGEAGCFGKEALYESTPVFIVEGAIDALSIAEAGGSACALGSTGGVDKFLEMLDLKRPAVPLILSLDTDKAGRDAQNKLKAGLETRKIPFYEINTSGAYKDPNEHLTADRAAFTDLVNSDPLEAERAAYLERSAARQLKAFKEKIKDAVNTPQIRTGYRQLDEKLGGGLFPGLYVIGAISALGKTTFVLQAADQMAQKGQDVLFFSLEMSSFELIAKSLSRLMFIHCGGDVKNAKTTRVILNGGLHDKFSREEKELMGKAESEYGEYAGRLFIHEGLADIGVERIRLEIKRHISFTGSAPVVIIDYLQILQAPDKLIVDKRLAVDENIVNLKRISRDLDIPVIGVSSFNRENYNTSVSLASFKESGGVEYTADCVIGLQLAEIDGKGDGTDSQKGSIKKTIESELNKDPRKIQLRILKNRNGARGAGIYYDYYPRFNFFAETNSPGEGLPSQASYMPSICPVDASE